MLLLEEELRERMESPMNLLNRLRNLTNPHKQNIIPGLPPTVNDIIEDVDTKIGNGSIKSKAMSIMGNAMDELNKRLPEVQKPERLAAIAAEMSKVVNNSQERSPSEVKQGQIIIYAPQIMVEENFNIIDLGE